MGNKAMPGTSGPSPLAMPSCIADKNNGNDHEMQIKIMERNQQEENRPQQLLYAQNSRRLSPSEMGINFHNIKHRLQEGTTIVSTAQTQKYSIHYTKFPNEASYSLYTDTLIYRTKTLRKCQKIKKQLNPIIGIYGEKVASCSACEPCTSYHVYVVEPYYGRSLDEAFRDDGGLDYGALKGLLESFVRVMSAYQYKRLRYGRIDFQRVFVICEPDRSTSGASDKKNYGGLFAKNKESERLNDSSDERKEQVHYICKMGDPFVRQFQEQSNNFISDRTKTMTDVYKNDVLKVGQALQQILKQKQNPILSPSQQKSKSFLLSLVQTHMTCPIQTRYNWLQIQRHFQQSNLNEKSTRPVSMLQSINTQHDPRQPEGDFYRSRSNQKILGSRQPILYQIPDLKSFSGRKLLGTGGNKENAGDAGNSFITLKPYKKSDSKPNILLSQPQPPIPSISKLYIPQTKPTTTTMQSHLGPIPSAPASHPQRSIFLAHEKNSGYGMVENAHPEYLIGGKIRYDSLYNIGRCWTKFEGNFVDGGKEGPGTIYLTNGHIFTGFFEKDLANGKGSVYINGELALKGTWKNNILVTEF